MIERASTRAVLKPWGRHELAPWHAEVAGGDAVGEIWFERENSPPPPPALLLKILLTSEPLSIQVHPDDAFARSLGLSNGKSEAWYVLSAKAEAQVAVGLTRQLSSSELRRAIDDGSIAELVQWRPVDAGDVVFVPAGTIHAVGAGLVMLEIQQRSDTTFRLFDYGRGRTIDADRAVAAASAEQREPRTAPHSLTAERTLLVASPCFVLEEIELDEASEWTLDTGREAWLFVLSGGATLGTIEAHVGDGLWLEGKSVRIIAGREGFAGLVAYVGSEPVSRLLQRIGAAERVIH